MLNDAAKSAGYFRTVGIDIWLRDMNNDIRDEKEKSKQRTCGFKGGYYEFRT